jgi:hypothetical protein
MSCECEVVVGEVSAWSGSWTEDVDVFLKLIDGRERCGLMDVVIGGNEGLAFVLASSSALCASRCFVDSALPATGCEASKTFIFENLLPLRPESLEAGPDPAFGGGFWTGAADV